MMEVTRRMRNLEPARPLRRLNAYQVVQTNVVAEPVEDTIEQQINMMIVTEFCEILNLQSQNEAPVKPERISYSRDFLIKLANSPMAKKKPDFLPDHPVVLDKGREPDTHKMFGNIFAKRNMCDCVCAQGPVHAACIRTMCRCSQDRLKSCHGFDEDNMLTEEE